MPGPLFEGKKHQGLIITVIALGATIVALLIVIFSILTRPAPRGVARQDPTMQLAAASYQRDQVRNTVTKGSPEIKKIYIDFLASEPSVTFGTIMVDWLVLPDGKAAAAAVISSTFNAPAFEKAIVDAVSRWDFPPPPDGKKTYCAHTFTFKTTE